MSEPEQRLTGQLLTRQSAAIYRNRLINLLAKQHTIVLDLSAVRLITPSFADECFGILGREYGKEFFKTRLQLKGASKDVRHLISVVVANRLKGRGASDG